MDTDRLPLSGMHVLVVDDNELNLFVLKKMLVKEGATVSTACDSEEAMNAIVALEPNLVIMDLSLPDRSGFETARLIRNLSYATLKTIPLISHTAYSLEEIGEEAISAGFNSNLPKPFTSKDLIDTLGPFLESCKPSAI